MVVYLLYFRPEFYNPGILIDRVGPLVDVQLGLGFVVILVHPSPEAVPSMFAAASTFATVSVSASAPVASTTSKRRLPYAAVRRHSCDTHSAAMSRAAT